MSTMMCRYKVGSPGVLGAVILISVGQWHCLATLVVLIPTNEGLIVAADSCSTVGKQLCNESFKILEVARPARTIVAVTGRGIILPPTPPSTKDLCHFVRTTTPLLDVGHLICNRLETNARNIGKDLVERELPELCALAIRSFRSSNRMALELSASQMPDRILFRTIIATYRPGTNVSVIGSFGIRIAVGTLEPEIVKQSWRIIGENDEREWFAFGETDYVKKYVFQKPGRDFLKAFVDFADASKKVAKVTTNEAKSAAINFIEAASRTTELIPPRTGIGGCVDVALLTKTIRPVRLQWKSKASEKNCSIGCNKLANGPEAF